MMKNNNNNHKKRKLRLDAARFLQMTLSRIIRLPSLTPAAYGASVFYVFAGGASHRYLRQVHFTDC